jgi:hypothetical protein
VLRVRPGDRVQAREGRDEGTVKAVEGTGVTAQITVDLDSGETVTCRPGELQLLILAS